MLEIVIPETEQYDEANGCFITTKKQVLRLEHSLVSLSKWESKWHKPYLSRKPKTEEEQIDYIRCMTLTVFCVVFRSGWINRKRRINMSGCQAAAWRRELPLPVW